MIHRSLWSWKRFFVVIATLFALAALIFAARIIYYAHAFDKWGKAIAKADKERIQYKEYRKGERPKEVILSPDLPDSSRTSLIGESIINSRALQFVNGTPSYFNTPESLRRRYHFKFIDSIPYRVAWYSDDLNDCYDAAFNRIPCNVKHFLPGSTFRVHAQYQVLKHNNTRENFLIIEDSEGNRAELYHDNLRYFK